MRRWPAGILPRLIMFSRLPTCHVLDFVCHVRWLCCIRPITITNLNVLSGIAERDNGDLITYILYKWSRDFRKPAYKAGKRAKRERTNGILLYLSVG
ncbi:hypothetical protein T05_16075 [Trichinella murrelli]|uniref:Secreted protein n=1 Tax=Trichinella murrelli TaxID=144512 RepID=A0A0V0T158_9BILA|nr:hypothetical protein T05_16075 [Trichinella murrelli]